MRAATGLIEALAGLPPVHFWCVLGLAVLGAGLAFWTAFRSRLKARAIEDAPTAKVASAPQGHVELNGVGPAAETTFSPLSGQACLWYRYTVHRKTVVRTSKGSHTRWEKVDSGCSKSAFWLEDGTGRCLVNPAGAEVTPHESRTWYGSSLRPPGPPPKETFLGAVFSFGDNYRYKEEMLYPRFPVYALGWFESITPGRDLEKEVTERLRKLKADPQALAAFDKDKDGAVDAEEWEAARAAAREEALKDRVAKPAEGPVHTLTVPADPSLHFLISGIPQEVLVRRYRVTAWAGIAAFFLLGAAAVSMLNARGVSLSVPSKTGTFKR